MAVVKNSPVEKLYIYNFFSLHNFEFEVKQFNVITGDIASGKSLVIKVVEFFETIFADLFNLSPSFFFESLNMRKFQNIIVEKFNKRFNLNKKKPFAFNIRYQYNDNKKNSFDVRIFREEKSKNIIVESKFIESEFIEWKKIFNNYLEADLKESLEKKYNNQFTKEQVEIRITSRVKWILRDRFFRKFSGYYPIYTTFVPASRAALAINRGDSEFDEYYFNKFNNLVSSYLVDSRRIGLNSKYVKKVNEILKAKVKINGDISLISEDGRDSVIANTSSGQQEIFYILFLLDKLESFSVFENHSSIFIEEPEAHLFPGGQKRVLELITQIFNDHRKKQSVKFFITTHSPYVLSTINNMLLKGNINEKISNNKELKKLISSKNVKKIPPLDYKDISVIFINSRGKAEKILKNSDGNYLINPKKINDISMSIENDCIELNNLNRRLLNKNKND